MTPIRHLSCDWQLPVTDWQSPVKNLARTVKDYQGSIKSTALDAVRKEQKNVLRMRNYPPSALRTVSFFFFFISLHSPSQAILTSIQIVAQGDY